MAWDLRHARIFVAVAETLHFSRAARSLGMAQPAVSRAVRWMEQDLGVRLLERSTRSVALTAEGALLLEECRRIVSQFDQSIKRTRSISAGLAGEVNVGCNDFAFLADLPVIVRQFRDRYPRTAVRLHEGHRAGQTAAMARGELDVSFVIAPVHLPGLSAVTTGSYRLAALLSNAHPLARKRSLHLRDLADEDFVLGNRQGWESYRDFLDPVFAAADFRPRIAQEVYGSLGILELVAAGLGVTIYPDCLRPWQRGGLAVRPLTDATRKLEGAVIWYPATLTRAAGHFMEFVLEYGAKAGWPAKASEPAKPPAARRRS